MQQRANKEYQENWLMKEVRKLMILL